MTATAKSITLKNNSKIKILNKVINNSIQIRLLFQTTKLLIGVLKWKLNMMQIIWCLFDKIMIFFNQIKQGLGLLQRLGPD